jgi:hypothetical protein
VIGPNDVQLIVTVSTGVRRIARIHHALFTVSAVIDGGVVDAMVRIAAQFAG